MDVKPEKGKRNSYTAEWKREIIKYAEEYGNRNTARYFNISEKSIRLWRKQKVRITECEETRRRFTRPKNVQLPQPPKNDVEETLQKSEMCTMGVKRNNVIEKNPTRTLGINEIANRLRAKHTAESIRRAIPPQNKQIFTHERDSGVKCTRSSYTAKVKREIIQYAEKNGNYAAARTFGASEKSIRYWRANKTKIDECEEDRKRFSGPKSGHFPELEEKVLQYVQETCISGTNLSYLTLQEAALKIAKSMNITLEEFAASNGWISGFLRRMGLSTHRQTKRQKQDFDEKLLNYQKNISNLEEPITFPDCKRSEQPNNICDNSSEVKDESEKDINITPNDKEEKSQENVRNSIKVEEIITDDEENAILKVKLHEYVKQDIILEPEENVISPADAEVKSQENTRNSFVGYVIPNIIPDDKQSDILSAKKEAKSQENIRNPFVKQAIPLDVENNTILPAAKEAKSQENSCIISDYETARTFAVPDIEGIPRKFNRSYYTIKQKQEIVTYAEENGNCNAVRTYGIDESVVRLWRRNKIKIFTSEEEPIREFEDSKLNAAIEEKTANADAGKPEKCKRSSYTAKQKREIITYAEEHSNRKAARAFGINEKSIRLWRQHKAKIIGCEQSRKRFTGPKNGRFPELEEKILKFMHEQRESGAHVTYVNLQEEALKIAKAMNVPSSEFKASRGWILRFMRRMGLSSQRRTTNSEKQDFKDKLMSYQNFINKLEEPKPLKPNVEMCESISQAKS